MRGLPTLRAIAWLAAGWLAAGLASAQDYAAEREPRRFALVIGNSDYATLEPVPSARVDASRMRERLLELGFEVSVEADLASVADLEDRVLPAFRQRLQPGDLVLLYFSGHGFAWGADTWLAPTAMPLRLREQELPDQAVAVESLQAYLAKRDPGLLLVLVDACRNPAGFVVATAAGDQGIAKGAAAAHAPSAYRANLIAAYAAQPGSTALGFDGGRASLFTGALLDYLGRDGREFGAIYNDIGADVRAASGEAQRPGLHDWSDSDLVLVPDATQRQREREAWQVALDSGQRALVQRYSWRHALSRHAWAARAWLQDPAHDSDAISFTALSPLALERAWQRGGSVAIARAPGDFGYPRSLSAEATQALVDADDADLGVLAANDAQDRWPAALARLLAHGEVVALTGRATQSSPAQGSEDARPILFGQHLRLAGLVDAAPADGGPWARANEFGNQAPVYFQVPAQAPLAPVHLGRGLAEILLPPDGGPESDLVAADTLDAALLRLREQGKRVTWVSLAITADEAPALRSARQARLQHAVHRLKRAGIDGRRVTSVAGSPDALGDTVRIRIFGYQE